MHELSLLQWVIVCLVFIWSGFVRSGLGFGGAALAMPLMLLIIDNPLLWLPIVAVHLLFFSGISLYGRLHEVDWEYLKKTMMVMIVPKIVGVLGLLNLPNDVLVVTIYGITLAYGLTYLFDIRISSSNPLVEKMLLVLGAYASGTSLVGAPLISAVYVRHVAIEQVRTTLFLLWILLVLIKVSTFFIFDVDMQFEYSLVLLPVAGLGHWLGLKMHRRLIQGDGGAYKRAMGTALVAICGYGLAGVWVDV